MISSRNFTIETRLNEKYNSELIKYFEELSILYGKMIRFAWQRIKDGGKFSIKKSEFNTLLQNKFGVSKRLANSVITEVTGIYNALYELKQTEYSQLNIKIEKNYKKYKKLQKIVNLLKEKAKNNTLSKNNYDITERRKKNYFY